MGDAITKALEVEGLTKVFDDGLTAVDNISFFIQRGTIHGIIGPNGSGKSTTMKMIVGLLQPTSGKIRVLGNESLNRREVNALIGYLPEIPRFPGEMTAYELLEGYSHFFRATIPERRKKIVEVLEMVDLLDFSHKKISSHTKGMIQRLGLTQALIGDPDLLILDEPTSGLDPMGVIKFRNNLKTLTSKGKTVLVSSHILSEVERFCDSVTILNHGRAVVSGRLEDIIDQAGNPVLEIQLLENEDHLITAVKSLPYVEDLRFDSKKILLTLATREDRREEISKTIISCGGTILSMKIINKTMEDAFVHYVSISHGKERVPEVLVEKRSERYREDEVLSPIRSAIRILGTPESGNDLELCVDIVNVGSESISLLSVSQLMPEGTSPKDVPNSYDFETNAISLENIKLGTLETHSLRFVLQPNRPGSLVFSPRIRYVQSDEDRLHIADPITSVVFAKESIELTLDSRKIFEYLKSEFILDYLSSKLGEGISGWRSLVQIARGSEVSLSSLYGKNGTIGHSLTELLSKGLADSRIFPKQRGRGGDVLKVRVKPDSDPMKKELHRLSNSQTNNHSSIVGEVKKHE